MEINNKYISTDACISELFRTFCADEKHTNEKF